MKFVVPCPQTGMYVQTHLEKQQRQEGRSFESFACPACTRLHFIDLASGQSITENVDGDIDLTGLVA